MDKLVFDIETKNTFQDVGGHRNIEKLETSFVGVYSYDQDKYLSFFEERFRELEELFKRAGLIIGFGITRFDIPVMRKYFSFNLDALPKIDILDEIELGFGRRVSLDVLARANIGFTKTHHGLKAIEFWKDGNLKELEDYCIQDVKVTKEVYELARKQGYLLIPDKFTGQNDKVELDFKEGEMLDSQSLF